MYLEDRLKELEKNQSILLEELRFLRQLLSGKNKPKEVVLKKITIPRAAEIAECSEATIRNKIKVGLLQRYDGEGKYKVLVDESEVERLKEIGEFKTRRKRVKQVA